MIKLNHSDSLSLGEELIIPTPANLPRIKVRLHSIKKSILTNQNIYGFEVMYIYPDIIFALKFASDKNNVGDIKDKVQTIYNTRSYLGQSNGREIKIIGIIEEKK